VTLQLEARAGASILGTEDRVAQAVTNLVANAIKFSPEQGTVRVETAAGNGQVEVRVHDQGPGIPEEFRSRIFGRFQQALGTSGGTGLGLAITKRIAERLGGSVGFECPPSGGTIFTLRIPAAAPELAPPRLEHAPLGPSILIVDPDASMRELLGALLVPNYAVVPVATLAEAAERLRDQHIVAAIIEPAVDDGEGLAFIQRLRMRDAYHDLPIVLFTDDDALASAAGAADIAASHVYRKSIDPEPQVARRVRAMLAARGIG
jgi:CheY-like chemotaxis protein